MTPVIFSRKIVKFYSMRNHISSQLVRNCFSFTVETCFSVGPHNLGSDIFSYFFGFYKDEVCLEMNVWKRNHVLQVYNCKWPKELYYKFDKIYGQVVSRYTWRLDYSKVSWPENLIRKPQQKRILSSREEDTFCSSGLIMYAKIFHISWYILHFSDFTHVDLMVYPSFFSYKWHFFLG